MLLDVNAPRNEIEDQEDDETEDEENDDDDDEMFDFEMEGEIPEEDPEPEDIGMKHPIAETLDICMDKIFSFLDRYRALPNDGPEKLSTMYNFYKTLMAAFENVILPSHNTHHVQFLVFYFCSFKVSIFNIFVLCLYLRILRVIFNIYNFYQSFSKGIFQLLAKKA